MTRGDLSLKRNVNRPPPAAQRRSNKSPRLPSVAHETPWLVRGSYLAKSYSSREKDMTESNEQFSNLDPNTQQHSMGSKSTTTSKSMKYYDLKKNWRRVKPYLADHELNDILVRDFNKFTFGRWNQTFTDGDLPYEFESCDWDCDHRGKRPAFWQYVKHSACHWLVNFTLRLAILVEPGRPWRIITSQKHSTVWDGDEVLFDFNFQALGIDPNESFNLAFERELKSGKYMRVYFAEHYSLDKRWCSGTKAA
jgi:hypothetical protein